jgi:WD repeat-containing protein 19
MVWSLQSIQNTEDQKLLAGHVAMFLQDFDMAQVRLCGGAVYCKELGEKKDFIYLNERQVFSLILLELKMFRYN